MVPQRTRQGAVATAFPDATRAAGSVLAAGGNAVDAAVAAAWALSVCEPAGSGLGGQTTMIVAWPGARALIIDGHSHAPAAASRETISVRQQRNGRRAATVPSTVATLAHAHRRFGSIPWAGTLEAAVAIADDGFRVTALQRRQIGWIASGLRAWAKPSPWLPDNAPPCAGALLRQPALAATLRRIAREGPEDFYTGEIGRAIADDMARHGGLITADDLASLSLPIERTPIALGWRRHRIVTAPAPGGGPTLLRALEAFDAQPAAADRNAWYEAIASAVFDAFAERESDAAVCGAGRPRTAGTEPPGETTHLVVMDGEGMVVSLTQSIQSVFGAKVMHPTLGFFYNNYLRTCPRADHPNALGARCRPRSNATPTVVFDDAGHPVLALGAAGSRRIISSILQVIARVLDEGASVDAAIRAARLHPLVDGDVWVEAPALTPALAARLERRFSRIRTKRALDYTMGAVQALRVSADGRVSAAADPRRDGCAAGVVL